MFFKRTKYPLPRFPSGVISTFKKLKTLLNADQIAELRTALEEFIEQARHEGDFRFRARLPIAEVLHDRCRLLLDVFEKAKPEDQMYIGAAVRYVVMADDPFSDDTFLTGLDDDVRVVNHVLEKLKLFEEIIELAR